MVLHRPSSRRCSRLRSSGLLKLAYIKPNVVSKYSGGRSGRQNFDVSGGAIVENLLVVSDERSVLAAGGNSEAVYRYAADGVGGHLSRR